MTTAGVSPTSSPRLPSPPPFTEVQIGPQSPSVGEPFSKDADLLGVAIGGNDGPTRRIRPGTRSANMAAAPPVIPLSQINSPSPLQEHLKSQYYELAAQYPKLMEKYDVLMEEYNERKHKASDDVDLKSEVTKEPTKPESAAEKLTAPPMGVEDIHWKYELCRFFTMEANRLVQGFLDENPPCSAQTCPEMRVVEWQYICAAHSEPQPCCAIDYCCHTLDWAMDTLTSADLFPSKLKLKSKGADKLPDIFRRLYRIFAHAWFRHPAVFSKVENDGGLYVFFKTVCVHYGFVGDYTIPLKAGGPDEVAAAKKKKEAKERKEQTEKKAHKGKEAEEKPINSSSRFTILQKEGGNSFDTTVESQDPALVTGATARRHKHSPSTGSRVNTIAEDSEDSEEITPSSLRESLKQSPEPRPVSVLGIQTRQEDVGKSSEESVEESQEQPPQEPYEEPSEIPEDQEKSEQAEQTEQNEQAREPISEESSTNTESPIEKYVTEGDENKTSPEEATQAEEPEAKIEATQKLSVTPATKYESEKEES